MSEPLAATLPKLCALAAQRLGWRPAEFWLATPAELVGCLTPPDAAISPMSRTDFAAMMEHDDG